MSEEKQKIEPVETATYDSKILRLGKTIGYVGHTDDGARIITRPDGKRVRLYLP